jgi:hypothetical protein
MTHHPQPLFPIPALFDAVLADTPTPVADALLAAWHDPSPCSINRVEVTVTLHVGGPETQSSEAAVLWMLVERVAGRDLGSRLVARLAELHA